MQTLTFIVGPTATGKTQLALQQARAQNANILSADSRQIYKDLNITSGADISPVFQEVETKLSEYSYLTDHNINLFGVSFLSSDQEWSIAHFRNLAENALSFSQQQGKSLIIVGGSGLYLQSLFLNKNQLHLKPLEKLRREMEQKPIEELQQLLTTQHPDIAKSFNHSDWHNPRRLIRWLEKITQSEQIEIDHTFVSTSPFGKETDHNWIGLNCEKELLKARIEERVQKRLQEGSIPEVQHLLEQQTNQNLPALSTLGVKEIRSYLYDQITKPELIELWTLREFQYAKRQLTWFKKRTYIQWQNILQDTA